MPQGHHYENTLLDNCYLYTLDEKYEESVKQELGKNAANVKIVFLKNQYKDFKLKKVTINSDFDGFDERETFNIIYEYFKNKYKLNTKRAKNILQLEGNNYSFEKNVQNYIVQGKFVKLEDIQEADRIKIMSKVDTHKNGFELRHAIGEISSRIGLRYDRTRVILERMFETSKGYSKRFLNLKIAEFYAFIINNVELLKKDFSEAVTQKSRQLKLKLESIKTYDWSIPVEDYVKYDSKMKDTSILEKSVYINYPNSVLKSKSERMFEFYCDNSENVKWFYKNGESSDNYFSIVYIDAINRRWYFYPDFIMCDKNNKIWIVETKGGEDVSGNSKNIDMKVENKFEALKEYAKTNNINWAFIRDYDKNDKLYYCNTEYTEDMETDNWILIDEMFE